MTRKLFHKLKIIFQILIKVILLPNCTIFKKTEEKLMHFFMFKYFHTFNQLYPLMNIESSLFLRPSYYTLSTILTQILPPVFKMLNISNAIFLNLRKCTKPPKLSLKKFMGFLLLHNYYIRSSHLNRFKKHNFKQ